MFRKPVVAGTFYPDNEEDIVRSIEECFLSSFGVGVIPEVNDFDGGSYPINVMVPHAGYFYSGSIASFGYAKIAENGIPDVFIILAPNHTGLGSEVSVFNEGVWETPLGNVEVDEDFADKIISFSDYASADFLAHSEEHSIEVQLPFLQYFSDDFKIVPIVMGCQSLSVVSDLATAIVSASREVNRSYCLIASTDLSHFNDQKKANKVDGFVLDDIEDMDEFKLLEEVIQYNITMCGYGPVMTTILVSKLTGKESCEILSYGTSGDVTQDYLQVVGYASAMFR